MKIVNSFIHVTDEIHVGTKSVIKKEDGTWQVYEVNYPLQSIELVGSYGIYEKALDHALDIELE